MIILNLTLKCLILLYIAYINNSLLYYIIQPIIKNVGEELIKVFIYPTQAEMRSLTEEYVAKNYESFYKTFTKKRWNIYYEGKIHPTVCINI